MSRTDLKVELVFKNPKDLIPYSRNTKKHPAEQIQKIIANIHANGFDQPITVDKEMVIITGHGRQMAAIELGLKQVPVIIRDDLSEEEVKAKRIADNKLNESDWDNEFLSFELQSLYNNNEVDIDLTGFGPDEIKKLIDTEVNISEIIGENDGSEKFEDDTQFLVTIHCDNESHMQEIYDEMKKRKLNVTLMK